MRSGKYINNNALNSHNIAQVLSHATGLMCRLERELSVFYSLGLGEWTRECEGCSAADAYTKVIIILEKA